MTKTTRVFAQALAAQRHASLSRRHFLRGLGACMALPAFETLRPGGLSAAEAASASKLATTSTGAPMRAAFMFFPNGSIPGSWWPKEEGDELQLSPTLKPLEPTRKLVQVLGGLDHLNATAGRDGGGDHARGSGVFLTGVRLKKSTSDVHAGISIDQAIARQVGHLTRFPSLEMTCDNGRSSTPCEGGYACAYQYNISWSSPTTPMPAESNPRLVFERLFGVGEHGTRRENTRRRQQEQKSILDYVMEDARRMQQRMASRDQAKLDQYLTSVREIELRIQQAERFGSGPDPDLAAPAGVPDNYGQYIQLMFDLMVLAFQTDSTRVASFTLAHDGSNRSFGEIGIPEGHHDLSHHQNNEERVKKVARIDLWYAQQFGKLLEKLNQTKDLDGNSLLHNSMIVYGSGNGDGNRHTHANLPIVLAGAGGGTLRPGRYVKHGSKPTSNLFLSLADRMGMTGLERFGDSTGRLENV